MLHLQLLDPATGQLLDELDSTPLVAQVQELLGIDITERFPQVASISPDNFNIDDLVTSLDIMDGRLNSLAQRESTSQEVQRPISELSEIEKASLPMHQSVTIEGIGYVKYTQLVVQENNQYAPVQAQLQALSHFLKECRNQKSVLRNLAYN